MDMDNNEFRSAYNDAYLSMMRLNNSYNKCNYYSTTGKLIEWRWELDCIVREFVYDMLKKGNTADYNDIEDNVYYQKLKQFDKEITKSFLTNNKAAQYKCLNNKEMYLRWLQGEVGKGSKYIDLNEDGIEE